MFQKFQLVYVHNEEYYTLLLNIMAMEKKIVT